MVRSAASLPASAIMAWPRRGELDQSGTFVVRIGDKFHQSLLLEAIDQNLNILTGAEAGAGKLGNGLWAVALEELKSSATCIWECGSRVGFQAIGQAIYFDEQGFKPFLKDGSVRC